MIIKDGRLPPNESGAHFVSSSCNNYLKREVLSIIDALIKMKKRLVVFQTPNFSKEHRLRLNQRGILVHFFVSWIVFNLSFGICYLDSDLISAMRL